MRKPNKKATVTEVSRCFGGDDCGWAWPKLKIYNCELDNYSGAMYVLALCKLWRVSVKRLMWKMLAMLTVQAALCGTARGVGAADTVTLFVRQFPAPRKSRGCVWLAAGGPDESGAALYSMVGTTETTTYSRNPFCPSVKPAAPLPRPARPCRWPSSCNRHGWPFEYSRPAGFRCAMR